MLNRTKMCIRDSCGAPLWTALNPEAWRKQTAWAKIGDYGFVYRPLIHEHLKKADRESLIQKFQDIQPVSYTHLDVYKRQLEPRQIHRELPHPLLQGLNSQRQGEADGNAVIVREREGEVALVLQPSVQL